MLDIKWIAENTDLLKTALANRNTSFDLDSVLGLYDQKKKLQQEFDSLRSQQNVTSKEIAQVQKAGGDASAIKATMQTVAERIKTIGPEMADTEEKLNALLLVIPNIPHASVPVGKDEHANKEVRKVGTPRVFDFEPVDHADLGEKLGILDFERGAKIGGSRFTLYRGIGARMERALIQFMLDVHTEEHKYEEIWPPLLVNAESMKGTGQLPKFEEDLFKTTDGRYLIPTAEVPVTNIFRDEILREEDLPIKFCSYTPCFRSEAGSYGKDVKGLIRQHQFNKVELVTFSHPDKSYEVLESLTGHAETILKKLELPYRTITLCTGDMGFGSAKTYDIEVWLPAQKAYREISSCTNFEDFQARRMQIRFKDSNKKNRLVHTLNGSGLAVGRTLVAILENYQNKDGSVNIPIALRPYLNGMEKIK